MTNTIQMFGARNIIFLYQNQIQLALKKSFVYWGDVWCNSLSLASLKQSKPLANLLLETLHLKQLINLRHQVTYYIIFIVIY